MTLDEIKAAVESGQTVHWANENYRVIHDDTGQWLIMCDSNKSCIGLTWRDGATMNGEPEQFYIAKRKVKYICEHCGEDSLVFSANSYWNIEEQSRDHAEDEGDPYCPNCQCEVGFREEEM